jgi:hypothetical protein
VSNKGIEKRRKADEDLAMMGAKKGSRHRALERKAQLYKSIKRGDIEQKDSLLLVDIDPTSDEEGRLRDDDGDDDDVVEVTDEFGRTRTVARSQAHKYELRSMEDSEGRVERPDKVLRGDIIQSEAFQVDRTRLAEIWDEELHGAKDSHYDANWEKRDRGVGFYEFSKDSEERAQQMESLKKIRDESLEEQSRSRCEQRASRVRDRLERIRRLRNINEMRASE